MTKLVPIEDHVIVEPIKEDQKTIAGIVLPDSVKEKPGRGKVVAVGAGKIGEDGKRGPMDVSVGDTVFFTKYSPDEIEVVESDGDKQKYLVIRHSSILAKLS